MQEDIIQKTVCRKRNSSNPLVNSRFQIMTVHTWCTTNDGEAHPAEIGIIELTIRVSLLISGQSDIIPAITRVSFFPQHTRSFINDVIQL